MGDKHYLFTYIISYRHRIDRINNLRKVLDWASKFFGVEIIVVEQDKTPKLKSFSLSGFKHIFIKSDLPFNKSNAFNVGIKYSSTNIIVFGDSDLIMDQKDFIDSLSKLEEYDVVSPYKYVIDLHQDEVDMNLNHMKLIDRPYRGENDNQKVPLCGGIIMYSKKAIYKIGGWCEDFFGWGCEDDFQSFKTEKFLNYCEVDNRVYHLWHGKEKLDMTLYQKNRQLLDRMSRFDDSSLIKHVKISSVNMGIKNKFNK